MKNLIILILIICPFAGLTQSCPVFTPGSTVATTAPGTYVISVPYNGNGTAHLIVSYYDGPPAPANLISQQCIITHGSGVATITWNTTVANPRIVIHPATGGSCSGGSVCTSQAITLVPVMTATLPITMNAFFAIREKNVVKLNWSTSTELNLKEIVIQRNTGNGFTDVQTVPATNNPNGASYSATDVNEIKSVTFYRIKMVEFDGTYTTSETRSVKSADAEVNYSVFPNPASTNGKIYISDINTVADIQLIDMTGRVIKAAVLSNSNNLDLNNIQKGTYQLRIKIRNGNEIINRKLVVN